MARAAREERRAELVLQALDLPADGRLREVQLVGGAAEAQAPRDRLEGPQAGQRERPAAWAIHSKSASMSGTDLIGMST